MNPLRRLDDQIPLAVNDLARHSPALHAPVLAYAKYGVVLFGALLLAALISARHRSSRALAVSGWAAVAMLAALALNQPLGHHVGERRPYVIHPGILRLADVTTDFSFPCDHAVMAGAVAVGLLLGDRRLGTLAALAALLMAFARVYIGAHNPWDVLGGLLLARALTAFAAAVGLVASLGWALLKAPLTWLVDRLRALPALRTVFACPHEAIHTTTGRVPEATVR